MSTIAHDFRTALRALRRSKGVTLVAGLTLAIGIATVTTIFSFVNSALFRLPPYPDAERMAALSEERPNTSADFSRLSRESIEALRTSVRSFERIGVYTTASVTLAGGERSVQLQATAVDTAVLPMLGVVPQRGRLPTADEIRERVPVALIADQLWRSRFGASEAVIGQVLRLDGVSHTVVGVAPAGFGFPERAQLWLPLDERSDTAASGAVASFSALGKLREGATLAQARADARVIGERLSSSGMPHLAGVSLVVREGMVDRGDAATIGPLALTFLGAAMCVLLIACTNVGNLMLARAAERRTEMAVRSSLGASRGHLIRQSLAESLVLGLVAGVAGTALSIWAVPVVLQFVPTHNFPSWIRFGTDVRVLAFALGASLLAVTAFGLPPALGGSRLDPMSVLKGGGGSATRGRRVTRGARRGVVVELALSVTLFTAAVLLWQTYRNLAAVNPGYDAEQVLETMIVYDDTKHADARSRARLLDDVSVRLAAHPSVAGVATRGGYGGLLAAGDAPSMSTGAASSGSSQPARLDRGLYLPENPEVSVSRPPAPRVWDAVVSERFFAVMGIPILRGRGFLPSDDVASAPVAIVSEQLARGLWPGADPVGRQFRVGREGPLFTVIGVARDIAFTTSGARGLDAGPKRSVYYSARQVDGGRPSLLVRVRGDAEAFAPTLLAAIRSSDPDVAAWTPETLAAGQRDAMLATRLAGGFMGAFALAALLLATIGIYGVLAYGVVDRTREIGIRMALGGDAGSVVRMVVGEGMRFAGIGLAIGVVLALGAAPLLRRFVWNASVNDPLLFAFVVSVFGTVALLACWIPARRATRVEPVVALRAE